MSPAASTLRIALIGDQNLEVKAHVAIPRALGLAAAALGVRCSADWLPTATISVDSVLRLRAYQGIWCVPGSPYASMAGAMLAIGFARENRISFLGTCGGSQHALIEYCRNVLDLTEADHAESNPASAFPLIAALPCALRETEAAIHLVAGSRIRAIYNRPEISEPFNCGFGLNPSHQHLLQNGAMRITGTNEAGHARVVELEAHPFFVGTLFQPERSAFQNTVHPLIVAFLQAAAAQ